MLLKLFLVLLQETFLFCTPIPLVLRKCSLHWHVETNIGSGLFVFVCVQLNRNDVVLTVCPNLIDGKKDPLMCCSDDVFNQMLL